MTDGMQRRGHHRAKLPLPRAQERVRRHRVDGADSRSDVERAETVDRDINELQVRQSTGVPVSELDALDRDLDPDDGAKRAPKEPWDEEARKWQGGLDQDL